MSLDKLINKERPTEERICPKHGAYTSTNFLGEHWTECPKCMIERRDAEAKEQIEHHATTTVTSICHRTTSN
jgi:hypothetical protein